MAGNSDKQTKERILDAAERLFADKGFAATSLREITARARVNLAAVHYHFGSKDDLIRAVFARRLGPMNRERIERLARLEAQAGTAGPPLERIVEAFLGPPLSMSRTEEGRAFMRLLGHAMSQPVLRNRRMLGEQFREVAHRFHGALMRACPELSPEETFWRLLFMVGSMAHTMALCDQLAEITDGQFDMSDTDALLRRLVAFATAGMGTPAAHLPAERTP